MRKVSPTFLHTDLYNITFVVVRTENVRLSHALKMNVLTTQPESHLEMVRPEMTHLSLMMSPFLMM